MLQQLQNYLSLSKMIPSMSNPKLLIINRFRIHIWITMSRILCCPSGPFFEIHVTFSCYRRYCRGSLSYICVKCFINVQSGKMKFEKKTYELNLEQFEATCAQLNAALQNKTYLVGNELSIGTLQIFTLIILWIVTYDS